MKKLDNSDSQIGGEPVLALRPRATSSITLRVPVDVVASLQRVAATRDMSVLALLKMYIGQGLRQDIANLYADRLIETTAQVLSKHLQSEEELSTIMHEIRLASAPPQP